MDTRRAIIGVAVAAVIVVASVLRARSSGTAELPFTPNPASDTYVNCRGWSQAELKKILADFRSVYEGRLGPSGNFKTQRVSADEFRITFPNDIPPTLLSFLVNYLQYPRDFDLSTHNIAVLAVVKLTAAFPVPSAAYVGQTARIYVPANDRQYDLVYVAVGSEYFEQLFTNMAWRPAKEGRIPANVKALW